MKPKERIRPLEGTTAIITGGASGIGEAFAKELASRGCNVVIADLQIKLAENVAAKINESGGKAKAVELDVTDFTRVEQLVQSTVKETNRLDFMFNNAGIEFFGLIKDYSIEDWNRIVDVNLRGVINGVQAAYPVMIKQAFGHIINTASMAGLIPQPGNVAYAATKCGVVGLSKSLRAEAASKLVRVSVLCPGFIRTPLLEGGKYGKTVGEMSEAKQRRLQEWIEKNKPMPVNIFAKKALDLILQNKAIIILPSICKLYWWINRLFPSLGMSLAQKEFLRMEGDERSFPSF